MDICWYSYKREKWSEAHDNHACQHIRTGKDKWKPRILINLAPQRSTCSVTCQWGGFEINVDPLKCLECLDKGDILWAVELRFAFTTNRALACNLYLLGSRVSSWFAQNGLVWMAGWQDGRGTMKWVIRCCGAHCGSTFDSGHLRSGATLSLFIFLCDVCWTCRILISDQS